MGNTHITLEQLIKTPEASIFKTVLAVSARANELAQGAHPLIKTNAKKVTTIALEEFAAGKVWYEEIKPKKKAVSQ